MPATAHPLVEAERRDLVSVLEELTEEQWSAPSLCRGWRVREVVAHTTMPYRYGIPRLLLAMLKALGDFDRAADACARADARAMTDTELLECLRSNVAHPWQPPRSDSSAALWHEVIHGLDITVALGADRRVPDERIAMLLGSVSPESVRYFGADLDGIRLCADDHDWEYGSGDTVSGDAQHLLLVLTGRSLPPGLLKGAPAERFTAPV
ncbi:maleylpyruvate isomerase family mycothiol-dependent enzyme [Rhodococcus sp. BL-253-APC-6A1W]|uniref:maleylpyruvate isomerase family mycothiol-dependent enzyme n=1 Tax=Rhodococcus sp. BL-253-APC-6A1W TaxID=2725307 RepID=UPI00146BE8B1|nr:maleylpyruvate isomerase family mycothiol-dependent enzyme [Rhodococcus sp. BL-253-APC-6A1W]NMD97108.1 maleylpyruvate isomerase family mycothiol-dependent enzyme [Rhodococcus sp. BL-253-APC-6A1W]